MADPYQYYDWNPYLIYPYYAQSPETVGRKEVIVVVLDCKTEENQYCPHCSKKIN